MGDADPGPRHSARAHPAPGDGLTLARHELLGALIARQLVAPERALDLTPAMAGFIYRASERDRAETVLMQMRAILYGTAPGNLEGGVKLYERFKTELELAAGLRLPPASSEPAGLVWPPPKSPKK